MSTSLKLGLAVTAALLGILSLYLGIRLSRESSDTAPSDISVASNNCCDQPDCANYNGDWEAGYNACVAGKCPICEGGAQECDNDIRCEAGENHLNCPSDCDEAGYSQHPNDTTCTSSNSDRGFGECDERVGLACVECPTTTNNTGNSFCTSNFTGSWPSYSPSDTFISEKCGGTIKTEPSCGNGTVETGEDCDPPGAYCSSSGNPGTCSNSCQCTTLTNDTVPAPTTTPDTSASTSVTPDALPKTSINGNVWPTVFAMALISLGIALPIIRKNKALSGID